MRRYTIILTIVAILLAGVGGTPVKSDSIAFRNLETIAVSLVVDQSGSMAIYDPEKLRETAAEIFVDLLSPDDYLGVVAFDDEVTEVLTITKIDSVSNRERIKFDLTGRFDARGNTDYILAFEQAQQQLRDFSSVEEVRKIIIFITDGIPDPAPERREEEEFMESYMESLWAKIDTLGEEGILVYPIGFGDIDASVLMEIAERTSGQAKVLNSPDGLAKELFSILVELKQRTEYLEGEYNVVNQETLSFPVDTYSAQSTLLFTYNESVEVGMVPPDGVSMDNQVQITKAERYSIVTIHQTEGEKAGDWQVSLTGNAEVSMVTSFDMAVKLWMEAPVSGVIHPVTDPIRISTQLTGELPEGAELEARITKNGVLDPQVLTLEDQNGLYRGEYTSTETPGTYIVDVLVRVGPSVITTVQRQIEVRSIPFIYTDFIMPEEGFLLGTTRLITGTLRLGSNNLTTTTGLELEQFDVVLVYPDGQEERYPLRDDGNTSSGDIRRGDGVHSAQLTFSELAEFRMRLHARGTYRGDSFEIEKDLERSAVHSIGMIEVALESEERLLQVGEALTVPITIKNNSNFSDVLVFEIPEDLGQLENNRLRLRPFEERTVAFRFIPVTEPERGILSIPIMAYSESEGKEVQGTPMTFNVNYMSRWGLFLNRVSEYGNFLQIALMVLAVVPVLYILLGILLYGIFVRPKRRVVGILRFGKKTSDGMSKSPVEVNLEDYHKERVAVSFDQEKQGDILIEGTRYKYSVFIETVGDFSKYAFRDGYRALQKKLPPIRLVARVEDPGILIQDKNIFRSIDLIGTTEFESGDIVFLYETRSSKRNKQGKNILEGKFERTKHTE